MGKSNPNLLINGWFQINQRGASSYTGTGIYCVDCWVCVGTVSVVSNGLTISEYIVQKIENESSLVGKTLTFSAMKSDGTIVSGTQVFDNSQAFYFANESGVGLLYNDYWNGFEVVVSNVTITAVKLELGTESTLANDQPPDKLLELRRCMRYFQVYYTSSKRPTYAEDFIPQMRADPTRTSMTIGGRTMYVASAEL